jgi:hypothetical protein
LLAHSESRAFKAHSVLEPTFWLSPRARPGLIEVALAGLLSWLLLVALRPATLATPFWWDAVAVYAPGAQWLEQHRFAAMPGVFPSDLGRGHTPLFYLVTALAFRLFGTSPVTGHALVMAFSVLTLVGTYALGAWIHGRCAGLFSALLLSVSLLFLTMSSETLPEIPITALTVVSVYAFARGSMVLCAVIGTVLVLFKETGVAAPLAILGSILIEAHRQRSIRSNVRPFLIGLIPLCALVGFFVWQRIAEGWWVLPYHADLFRERHSYSERFVDVLGDLAFRDGRWLATIGAIGMLLWRFRTRRWPAMKPFDATTKSPGDGTIVLVLVLIALANVGFFTQMFYLERYVLPAHPGLLVLIAGMLFAEPMPLRRARIGAVAIVALVAAIAVSHRYAGEGYASGETTFRYLHMVRAHQALYQKLEARTDDPVILTTWPMTDELRHPSLGWVKRPYRALDWSYFGRPESPGSASQHVDIVIASSGLGGYRPLVEQAQAWGMRRVHREQRAGASIEWWER